MPRRKGTFCLLSQRSQCGLAVDLPILTSYTIFCFLFVMFFPTSVLNFWFPLLRTLFHSFINSFFHLFMQYLFFSTHDVAGNLLGVGRQGETYSLGEYQ